MWVRFPPGTPIAGDVNSFYGDPRFDQLGQWHYQRDLEKFDGVETEADRSTHSRFLLYCAHGMMLFRNRVEALQYAMRRIGYQSAEPPTVNPQMWLDLEAAIERTRKAVRGSSAKDF